MTDENVETLDLIVFLAVARTGSFGAAAGEMRLATPSVSGRMSSLERKLAVELFVRTTHGSTLTQAGRRLVPYADRCLAVLREGHSAVRSDTRNRLTVAAPASLGSAVFAPVLRILSEASFGAHCRVAHSEEVISYLVDGTADVGLALNRVVPRDLIAHRLCRARMLAVCHPEDSLAHRQVVGFDELLTTSVAVYRWNPEAEALAEVFQHPRRPSGRPVHLLGLPSAVIDLVAENHYVGIVPEFGAEEPLRAGRVVTLPLALPDWTLDVQLICRRDNANTAGVKALLAAGMSIVSPTHRGETRM
ncbi:MAG: LysR family transcriptional regulator [Nocardioidaceae bacterium]